MYRNDRKKGGGGIMTYVSSCLTRKRPKIEKKYKSIEYIAIEVKSDVRNMVIIGIYRPPKTLPGDYHRLIENGLSYSNIHICNCDKIDFYSYM